MRIEALSGWTSDQKHVVAASFLGWTLDAFDFFLLVFVIKDIATEFGTQITDVTFAILLTLAMRPIGAYIFGRAADRWGRRPTLLVDVLLYSAIEFASGFAPNLMTLLILRAVFGVAMGGEWGVGASLTMESIPPKARGLVSGLLQSGYPMGYFLASIIYGLLFQYIGWRGMFMVGVIPALLVFYIRRKVPESPSWRPTTERSNTLAILRSHWRLGIYAVLLMTAFNFFSHGTQDLYPTFLQVQHHFSQHEVSLIAVIYNIGAIIGSGSPFPPLKRDGKDFRVDQTNNAYVYPGIGLGAIVADARRISDRMFLAAAQTVAEFSPAKHDPSANLLPPLVGIRQLSFHVALAVAKQAQAEGLADSLSEEALADAVRDKIWEPRYARYRRLSRT
jgi:MFS family permease